MSNITPSATTLFKILTPDEWTTFCNDTETQGSALDRIDGFIHFSIHSQLAGTLAKHFAGAGSLVLAEIPLTRLSGQDVRWEAARNGDLFPHLYGVLKRDSVSQHWSLHPDADGGYDLPERIRT